MRVLVLNGSPRENANTANLIDLVLEGCTTAFKHVVDWLSSSLSRLGLSVQSVCAGRSTSGQSGHVFPSEVEDRARKLGAWLAGS